MPIFSPHYNIDIFGQGDFYSASRDRRRMEIIDSHLDFFTDIVGDGRILGWAVTTKTAATLEMTLSTGMGVIDNFVTNTFGAIDFTLSDNRTSYVYARRKDGVVGGFSDFSNLTSLDHADTTAPAVPSGFTFSQILFNQLKFAWTANTEADFSKYIIQRSLDNITFTNIDEATTNTFTDEDLTQNIIYYYKVIAVDLSGNQSAAAASFFAKTLKDTRTPINGLFFSAFNGSGIVRLLWESSPSENVDHYEVVVQALSTAYEPIGSASTVTIPLSKTFAIISGLSNGARYRFSLTAVSINSISSEPLEAIGLPAFNPNPAEVDDVTVVFSEGPTDNINVVMNLSWLFGSDPYVLFPTKFRLTMVENGTRISEPIDVVESFSREIQLLPFKAEDGTIFYESLKEDTAYVILVQTVDDLDNVSAGVAVRVRTPSFKPVAPISQPTTEQLSDRSILANWRNSNSEFFSHNILTLTSMDLTTDIDTTIVAASDIGKATSYHVAPSLWAESTEYTFAITAVDRFDNQSVPVSFSFVTVGSQNVQEPSPPQDVSATARNKSITLRWAKDNDNLFITQYKVYRAQFGLFLLPTAFQLLETIGDPDIRTFTDFQVTNGTTYAYIVSAVDIFSQESSNPEAESSGLFSYVTATPRDAGLFTAPADAQLALSGSHNAVVTWTGTPGTFDGYEIWKSIGSRANFVLAGSVGASTTTFTDISALLLNGTTYYYAVRKFRNEATVLVTESTAIPQGSIPVAKVITANGAISIDSSIATELLNLEDPVRAETKRQLDTHKHVLDSKADRRIDLSSNIVLADWVTGNFQRYTTETDIEGADAYKITITGTVNTSFYTTTDSSGASVVDEVAIAQAKAGAPPILFEVVADDGVITFEFPLFAEDGNAPFTAAPELSVELLGVSEVQNTLPSNLLENMSATHVDSGEINEFALPTIQHEGRLGEALTPTQVLTTTDDNITFVLSDSAETIGEAITFYDVIPYRGGNNLIAASSDGILLSEDFGISWESKFKTPTAPTRLFFSQTLSKFFAITNKAVFVTENTLTSWNKMPGLENVKIIRDVAEDNFGNVYATTDLGVYKLDVARSSNFFSFEQTRIFGPRSTEAYAILWDRSASRLIVSNELGVLTSTNNGTTWVFSDEFDETKKIFSFVQEAHTTFALTAREVWRKTTGGDFSKVADLDASVARKMTIFNDRLYVATSEGIIASQSQDDIHTVGSITFDRIYPEININGNDVPVYSMNLIEDLLFLGTDHRLFFVEDSNIFLQFDQNKAAVPSVFVGGMLQALGFVYNNSENSVSFDERLRFDQVVTVANQYKEYRAANNGWAVQKFDAQVGWRLNGCSQAQTDEIEIDTTTFSSFTFPEFDETNSFSSGAAIFKTAAELDITRLVGIVDGIDNPDSVDENSPSLEADEELFDVVSDVMVDIEKFLSQLFVEARVVDDVAVEFPAINTDLKTIASIDPHTGEITLGSTICSVNITVGVFAFTSEFSKYDVMTADIIGATVRNVGADTHRELEDAFELINSGLPSLLSQVQHVNIAKAGIFTEQQYPGGMDFLSTPVQAVYVVPRNSLFYDNLNSDIDYQIEQENQIVNTSFLYPAAVVYVPDAGHVLVGGNGGLLSVKTNNFDIDFISLGVSEPFVKQLEFRFDTVYALTEKNLYASEDFGLSWSKVDRTGLPNQLFSFALINGNFVIGGVDGIYFKAMTADTWSKRVSSTNPVDLLFDPDIVFAIVDGQIQSSVNGSDFIVLGSAKNLDINAVVRHRSVIFIATNSGLYADNGSFYGSNPSFALQDILDDPIASAKLNVNALASVGDDLKIGLSDGREVVLNAGLFTINSDTNLDCIHQVLAVASDTWLFGFDALKVQNFDLPLKISTGAPI